MWQYSCNLKSGGQLRITDAFPGGGLSLSRLQQLLGGGGQLLETADEAAADVVLQPAEGRRPGLELEEGWQRFRRYSRLPQSDYNLVIGWRAALIYAVLAQILRGNPVMIIHGCLLQTAEHEGILLCGQSGMGKSTTGGRWVACGGQCPADDMILLEYGEERLYAHPLPTWSKCLVSLAGESYPFDDYLPLKALLALNRSEHQEEIRDVPEYIYLSSVYSACMLFNLDIFKKINPAAAAQVIETIKTATHRLLSRFPHRALYAHLDGNLRQTLEAGQLL